MSAALDVEQCAGCDAVQICTRWNPTGTWDYTKGPNPCRPVQPEPERELLPIEKLGIEIKKFREQHGIIDADEENKNRFRLRSLK
jgi:hypothetical protein